MSSCHHTESVESVIELCSVTPALVCVPVSHLVMSHSLRSHGQWPASLLCPWNSSGKNTGVACHSLLQGIFLTQGPNPDLLHCRQILYGLSHQRSLIWVNRVYLFFPVTLYYRLYGHPSH